jgi:predicted TPR repeat methyltransferase
MDTIKAHDEEAAQYDQQAREYDYYAYDVLFGMSFEYVQPHECLLDIGIGTGLASLSFAKAGLRIFGLDGSVEMLKVCEAKGFAKELKRFDLRNIPLPYSDNAFDHVISCGVFHFFGELEPITKEVARMIKPGGIFAFTVAAQPSEEKGTGDASQGYLERPTSWGVNIFAHGDGYIAHLLKEHCFKTLKAQRILMRDGCEDNDDILFKVFVAQQLHKKRPC